MTVSLIPPAQDAAGRRGPQLRLEQRELAVEARERAVQHREGALFAHRQLARAFMAAGSARDAAADAREATADRRERDFDLSHLLAPADDLGYGGDWPARRHTALDRSGAREDRLYSRLTLIILVHLIGRREMDGLEHPHPVVSLVGPQGDAPGTPTGT